MYPVLIAMLGIVVLASLVVVYVAYPHRGHDVPTAPWVGHAMRRGVRLLPTLDNQAAAPERRDAREDLESRAAREPEQQR